MVEKYISDLLFKHDSIILPTFGALTKKAKSASIHPVKHTFAPPSGVVSFNETIKKGDGKLSAAIVKGEKLTKAKADKAVKDYVDSIKAAMKEKKPFLIEKVGKFYVNAGGQVQFDADPNVNYSEDSFGLPEITKDPIIKDEKNIKLKKKPEDRKPIKKEIKAKTKEAKVKKKGSKTWIYLLIIVILLSSSAVFLYMHDDGASLKQMVATVKGWFQKEEPMPVDTVEVVDTATVAAIDTSAIDSTAMDTVDENASQPSSEILTELTGRYYVVCGGFAEVQNAINLRDKLANEGYPNAKVMEPKGVKPLYRVSIDDFVTMEEGVTKSKEENANFGNVLWVLKY